MNGFHRDMRLIGEFLPLIGEKYPNTGYLIRTEPTVAYYARDAVHFLEEAGLVTLKRDDSYPSEIIPDSPNKGLLMRSEAGSLSGR